MLFILSLGLKGEVQGCLVIWFKKQKKRTLKKSGKVKKNTERIDW